MRRLSVLRQLPDPGVYPKGSLDLALILKDVLEAHGSGEVGAMSQFIGIARATGRDGKRVVRVEMESYEEHANRQIRRICDEVRLRHELRFVGIWHLIGSFLPGEPIVLVVTAGARRAGTFSGLIEAVERYKREPALFKKEVYSDGTYRWVSD